VPCDVTDRCPYTPDGEMVELAPQAAPAVWLWQRFRVFGPAVFEFIDWELTGDGAEKLLEQLYTLETYSAALRAAQR
jgi:hypothetical protein